MDGHMDVLGSGLSQNDEGPMNVMVSKNDGLLHAHGMDRQDEGACVTQWP